MNRTNEFYPTARSRCNQKCPGLYSDYCGSADRYVRIMEVGEFLSWWSWFWPATERPMWEKTFLKSIFWMKFVPYKNKNSFMTIAFWLLRKQFQWKNRFDQFVYIASSLCTIRLSGQWRVIFELFSIIFSKLTGSVILAISPQINSIPPSSLFKLLVHVISYIIYHEMFMCKYSTLFRQ